MLTNRISQYELQPEFARAMVAAGFGKTRQPLTGPITEAELQTAGILPVPFPDTLEWSGMPSVGRERVIDCGEPEPERGLCFCFWVMAETLKGM